MLGIRNDKVAGTPGKGISQVVQSASDGTEPICTMLAQRAWPPLIVAAASDKFSLG